MFVSFRGHTLYRAGLKRGLCVVDLGVNHGGFREALLNFVGNAVFHGVEANPQLAEAAQANGYTTLEHAAISQHTTGTVRFRIAENDEASSILPLQESRVTGAVEVDSVEVAARTMESVLADIPGFIDVVKVDIEGAETDGLANLSPATLARVGQFTVEFHRDSVFQFDLSDSTRGALAHLAAYGFLALSFEASDIDVLLLNRTHFHIGPLKALILRVFAARRWAESAGRKRVRQMLQRMGYRS